MNGTSKKCANSRFSALDKDARDAYNIVKTLQRRQPQAAVQYRGSTGFDRGSATGEAIRGT